MSEPRHVKAWAEALLEGARIEKGIGLHAGCNYVAGQYSSDRGPVWFCNKCGWGGPIEPNAALIAAAPDLAAALVDQVGEVERLRGEMQEATRLLRLHHNLDGRRIAAPKICEACAFLASHPSPEAQQ